MANILVTGGTGFIGSYVVELFIAHGFEVVILDDLSIGRNPQSTFYQKEQVA